MAEASKISVSEPGRNRRQSRFWLLIPTVAWLLFISMSLLSAIEISEVAGLAWAVGCAAWGGGIWFSALLLLKRCADHLDSVAPFIAGLFATFALAILPPFVVMLSRFNVDLASSAAALAGIGPHAALVVGLVAYQIVRYPFTGDERRQRRLREEFESQFKDGPVGTWRSQSTAIDTADPLCVLTFDADGSGEFRERSHSSVDAPATIFHWRKAGQQRIDVRTAGSEWLELLMIFDYDEFAEEGTVCATLRFVDCDWLDRIVSEMRSTDVCDSESLTSAETGSWPVDDSFIYAGPPSLGSNG